MKKGLLLLICTALLISLSLPVLAAGRTVTVRIEGASDTLFYGEVALADGSVSVLDVLNAVNEADNGVTIEGLSTGYITAINGEAAGRTAEGWDGFGVRLNGKYLSYDRLATSFVSRDSEIVVYYADEFGAGLLLPQVDDSDLDDGTLRFFAEVPRDDGTYSVEAIVGAEVRWYCEEAYVTYVTDGEGKARIDKELLFGGDHRVAIDLQNEEGVPLLLRLSPDYTVNIPTAVGDSPAVYICIALAAVSAVAFGILLGTTLKCKKTRT